MDDAICNVTVLYLVDSLPKDNLQFLDAGESCALSTVTLRLRQKDIFGWCQGGRADQAAPICKVNRASTKSPVSPPKLQPS